MEQLVEQIRRDFVRWAVLVYPGDICQYIKASHGLSCCLKRLVYLIRVTDIAVVIAHMTTWKMFCQFFNEPLSLYVIDVHGCDRSACCDIGTNHRRPDALSAPSNYNFHAGQLLHIHPVIHRLWTQVNIVRPACML